MNLSAYESSLWPKLREGIEALLEKESLQLAHQPLYCLVYNACCCGLASRLECDLLKTIARTARTRAHLQPTLQSEPGQLISTFNRLLKVLSFLDREYCDGLLLSRMVHHAEESFAKAHAAENVGAAAPAASAVPVNVVKTAPSCPAAIAQVAMSSSHGPKETLRRSKRESGQSGTNAEETARAKVSRSTVSEGVATKAVGTHVSGAEHKEPRVSGAEHKEPRNAPAGVIAGEAQIQSLVSPIRGMSTRRAGVHTKKSYR